MLQSETRTELASELASPAGHQLVSRRPRAAQNSAFRFTRRQRLSSIDDLVPETAAADSAPYAVASVTMLSEQTETTDDQQFPSLESGVKVRRDRRLRNKPRPRIPLLVEGSEHASNELSVSRRPRAEKGSPFEFVRRQRLAEDYASDVCDEMHQALCGDRDRTSSPSGAAVVHTQHLPVAAYPTLLSCQDRQRQLGQIHKPARMSNQEVRNRIQEVLQEMTCRDAESVHADIVATGMETEDHVRVLIAELFMKATSDHNSTEMCSQLAFSLNEHFSTKVHLVSLWPMLLDMCQSFFVGNVELFKDHSSSHDAKQALVLRRMYGNMHLIGQLICKKVIPMGVCIPLAEDLLASGSAPSLGLLAALLKTIVRCCDDLAPKVNAKCATIFDKLDCLLEGGTLDERCNVLIKDTLDFCRSSLRIKILMTDLASDRVEQFVDSCQVSSDSYIKVLVSELFERATADHESIDMYAELCVRLNEVFEERLHVRSFRSALVDTCQFFFERSLASQNQLKCVPPRRHAIGNMHLVGKLISSKLVADAVGVCIGEQLLSSRSQFTMDMLTSLMCSVSLKLQAKILSQSTGLKEAWSLDEQRCLCC